MDEIYLTEFENANIAGPRIVAESFEEAEILARCYSSTIGRLKVIGKLICEFEEINLN